MLPVQETSNRCRRFAAGVVAAGVMALGAMAGPLAGPAAAQQSENAQAGGASLGSWIKLCAPDQANDNQEVCLVTQEVRTETGEFLASVSVQETKNPEGKHVIRAAVPLGTLIQPGIRLQIDEGEQVAGKYVICLPNACYAEMEIGEAFVNSLKAGNNLVVLVINNQGKAVGIGLTLIGFTKTWDGAPVPMEELAQQRQKLQDELQKRAEEARQKLLDGQEQQSE